MTDELEHCNDDKANDDDADDNNNNNPPGLGPKRLRCQDKHDEIIRRD